MFELELTIQGHKKLSEMLQKHLTQNLDYNQFWQPKGEFLVEIEENIKLIIKKYDELGQFPIIPPPDYNEYKDEKIQKIRGFIDSLGLVDNTITYNNSLYQNPFIQVFINEFNEYKKDTENYKYDILEPIKTDVKERILQLEYEIKNNVGIRYFYNIEDYQRVNDNKESYRESFLLETKSQVNKLIFQINTSQVPSELKEITINSIKFKYENNTYFYLDKHINRLDNIDSLNNFSIKDAEKISWEFLRYYIKINFFACVSNYERFINQILEDAELLKQLGYFENVTPSVSKVNPEDIELLEKVSFKSRALYYKILMDLGFWGLPKVDINLTLSSLGIKHGYGKDGSHFRKEIINMANVTDIDFRTIPKKNKKQTILLLEKYYEESKERKVKQQIDKLKKL